MKTLKSLLAFAAVLMIAKLPATACIPELVIKPTTQDYV